MYIRPIEGCSRGSFPSPGRNPVAVLMSGGVDSSVAAWLLKASGWDVAGVTMKIPRACGSGAHEPEGWENAAAAADFLSIPLFVADMEDEFRRMVMHPFVDSYLLGRTPNPCADCNAHLKFGLLWDAMEGFFGPTAVASGHYARVEKIGDAFALARGKDRGKDQSYFLYGIQRTRLPRLLLPLGDFTKQEVRALARKASLPSAERPESMEICFAGEGDYRSLMGGRLFAPGIIADEDGNPLGSHPGVGHFTVGQRKGLGIPSKDGLYVLRMDPVRNLVVVGPRERTFARRVLARKANVLLPGEMEEGRTLYGKTRSRGEPASCVLLRSGEGELRVLFHEPQFAPTPGQHLVLFDGEGRVVGGGVIEREEGEEWTGG